MYQINVFKNVLMLWKIFFETFCMFFIQKSIEVLLFKNVWVGEWIYRLEPPGANRYIGVARARAAAPARRRRPACCWGIHRISTENQQLFFQFLAKGARESRVFPKSGLPKTKRKVKSGWRRRAREPDVRVRCASLMCVSLMWPAERSTTGRPSEVPPQPTHYSTSK